MVVHKDRDVEVEEQEEELTEVEAAAEDSKVVRWVKEESQRSLMRWVSGQAWYFIFITCMQNCIYQSHFG
jgi:hypothetical protein